MALNDLHTVGVTEEYRDKVEGVDPRFIKEKLLWARDQSWRVFREIQKEFKEGLTEIEARQRAMNIFSDHGVQKHWHKTQVRLGPGTMLTFHDPPQNDYRLRPGDMIYMDLGPVWFDPESQIEYEGDVGDSFVWGENPSAEKCASDARTIFDVGRQRWLKDPEASGQEMYQEMKLEAEKRGYNFLDNVVGHRLSDFPHQKYSREKLPQINFKPQGHLWILELQITNPQQNQGAFYEDLLSP